MNKPAHDVGAIHELPLRNTNEQSQGLPEGWVIEKIGNLTEVIRGASPRPKGDPRYFGGNIPWIMISDVTREQGKYLYKTKDNVTEEGAKKSRYLRAGTLILSNSGTVCVPKILGVDGCIHDGFVAFPNLNEKVDIHFLYHYANYIRPRIIQENKQGITQVNLNTNIVKDIKLYLAPLLVQKLIVAEIEKQFSRLDEAVAALRRAQANLKRYKASVLKAAVEGKLTEEWRTCRGGSRTAPTEYESGADLLKRILAERRRKWEEDYVKKYVGAHGHAPKDDLWKKKYKEHVAPDTSNLPELPEGWVWGTVEQLCFIASGQTPKGIDAISGNGDIPWFRVGDMNTQGNEKLMRHAEVYLTKELSNKLKLHIHPTGTIIFPKRGGAIATNKKRILTIPSAYDLNTMGIRPIGMHDEYFWYWFLSIDLGSIGDGSNIPQINNKDIEPLLVPLPPLLEQTQITEEVDCRLSVAEEIEAVIETNLKRAERMRQAILKKAFEGRLVK